MVEDNETGKPKVDSITPVTPMDDLSMTDGLKRKREDTGILNGDDEPEDDPEILAKRMRSTSLEPPPPPPAPIDGTPPDTNANPGEGYYDEPEYSVLAVPPPPPPAIDFDGIADSTEGLERKEVARAYSVEA